MVEPRRSRARRGIATAVAAAAAGAFVGSADAQTALFPNAGINRERVPCDLEDPVYRQYRNMYYGYHPTCWRRFPEGWGCPSPEAPNAAEAFRKLPLKFPEDEPEFDEFDELDMGGPGGGAGGGAGAGTGAATRGGGRPSASGRTGRRLEDPLDLTPPDQPGSLLDAPRDRGRTPGAAPRSNDPLDEMESRSLPPLPPANGTGTPSRATTRPSEPTGVPARSSQPPASTVDTLPPLEPERDSAPDPRRPNVARRYAGDQDLRMSPMVQMFPDTYRDNQVRTVRNTRPAGAADLEMESLPPLPTSRAGSVGAERRGGVLRNLMNLNPLRRDR